MIQGRYGVAGETVLVQRPEIGRWSWSEVWPDASGWECLHVQLAPDRSGNTWVVPGVGLLARACCLAPLLILSVHSGSSLLVSGRDAVPVPGCWWRSPVCWPDLPGMIQVKVWGGW